MDTCNGMLGRDGDFIMLVYSVVLLQSKCGDGHEV